MGKNYLLCYLTQGFSLVEHDKRGVTQNAWQRFVLQECVDTGTEKNLKMERILTMMKQVNELESFEFLYENYFASYQNEELEKKNQLIGKLSKFHSRMDHFWKYCLYKNHVYGFTSEQQERFIKKTSKSICTFIGRKKKEKITNKDLFDLLSVCPWDVSEKIVPAFKMLMNDQKNNSPKQLVYKKR